jgi:hypothetical protein
VNIKNKFKRFNKVIRHINILLKTSIKKERIFVDNYRGGTVACGYLGGDANKPQNSYKK